MKNLIVIIGMLGVLASFSLINQNSKDLVIEKTFSHQHNEGVCPDCNGVGNQICSECEGDKIDVQQVACTKCNGDKMIPCPVCKGTRYVPCTEENCNDGLATWTCNVCYGKSAEEVAKCERCEGSRRIVENCRICEGRGEVLDPYCAYNGNIDCDECNGYGFFEIQRPCQECKGVGYNKCKRCNGTGEID